MYTIHTKGNRLIHRQTVMLEAKDIICNDVNLPKEFDEVSNFNPYNIRLWVIGNEYGAVCAIFASHEQDALDNACDANAMESFLVTNEEDLKEYHSHDAGVTGPDYAALGNASELHDLNNCWIAEVDLQANRDIMFIVKLARASEGGHNNLDF